MVDNFFSRSTTFAWSKTIQPLSDLLDGPDSVRHHLQRSFVRCKNGRVGSKNCLSFCPPLPSSHKSSVRRKLHTAESLTRVNRSRAVAVEQFCARQCRELLIEMELLLEDFDETERRLLGPLTDRLVLGAGGDDDGMKAFTMIPQRNAIPTTDITVKLFKSHAKLKTKL